MQCYVPFCSRLHARHTSFARSIPSIPYSTSTELLWLLHYFFFLFSPLAMRFCAGSHFAGGAVLLLCEIYTVHVCIVVEHVATRCNAGYYSDSRAYAFLLNAKTLDTLVVKRAHQFSNIFYAATATMCEKKNSSKNNILLAGIPFAICIRVYAFFANICSFPVVDKWAIFAPLCCELFVCCNVVHPSARRMESLNAISRECIDWRCSESFHWNNFEKRPHESIATGSTIQAEGIAENHLVNRNLEWNENPFQRHTMEWIITIFWPHLRRQVKIEF